MRIITSFSGLLLLNELAVANLLTRRQTASFSWSASSLPSTVTGTAPAPSASSSEGPNCGLGYTYCGFMLQNTHGFSSADVNKAYCDGMPGFCDSKGVPTKTKPDQALYICMNEKPGQVILSCACADQCLNVADSKYIAHCDSACFNTNGTAA